MNKVIQDDLNYILSHESLFNSLRNRKILVTGATGLIGSMIIKTLCLANSTLGTNIRIIGHGRSYDKVVTIFGSLSVRSDISFIYSDNFDMNVSCDYIIHGASPTESKFFVEHPVETLKIAFSGTEKVLEVAKKNNVLRMVYLSSMEQYGVSYEAEQVLTEKDNGIIDHLTARSSYSQGKRAAECLCYAYHSEYNVPVSIARLAQTFGAGVPLSDNRVFMQFVRSVVNETDIVLHTTGQSMSNFCYLSDTITGILTILVHGERGEAYNVCHSEETRSYMDIACLVADEVANGAIKVEVNIPESIESLGYAPDVKMYLNSDKLMSLGWKPTVTMKEAYKKLVKYIQEEEQ